MNSRGAGGRRRVATDRGASPPAIAVDRWAAQLDALAGYDRATPAALVGDFNATADHSQFRAITNAGWTDAHDPKGCGYDATWPADQLMPVLRLDHALLTDHFEVRALDLGPGNGSDHRSLTTTIRLTPASAATG